MNSHQISDVLKVLEDLGWKSKSEAPRAFKFCAKRVPIEVNNWSKFGVDIFHQFSKTIFIPSWGHFEEEKFSNLNISELVRDINTKFSPVVNLYRNPLCTKFEGSRCFRFEFPAKSF